MLKSICCYVSFIIVADSSELPNAIQENLHHHHKISFYKLIKIQFLLSQFHDDLFWLDHLYEYVNFSLRDFYDPTYSGVFDAILY